VIAGSSREEKQAGGRYDRGYRMSLSRPGSFVRGLVKVWPECYGGGLLSPVSGDGVAGACAKLSAVMGEPIGRCVADHLAERDAALPRVGVGCVGCALGVVCVARVMVSDGRRQR